MERMTVKVRVVCSSCSSSGRLIYLLPDGVCPACATAQEVRERSGEAGNSVPPMVSSVPHRTVPGGVVVEPDWIPAPEPSRPVYTPGYRIPAEMQAVWSATVKRAPYGNIMLVGPKGSGKTEGPKALAERETDMPVYKIDAASMGTASDWIGTPELVVKDGVAVTHFNESLFTQKVQTRCCIVLDEINRIRDEVRQILIPILDASRQVTNTYTGTPIIRHPECVIVMTGNIGMQYTGTSAIDPAFTDRSRIVKVGYVGKEIECEILSARYPDVAEATVKVLVDYATEIRAKAGVDPDWTPLSTRQLLAMCEDITNGLDTQTAVRVSFLNALSTEGGVGSIQHQATVLWVAIGGKR